MCENPIYIVSTTKKINGQLTKVGYHVPCGKCESCRQAMRDEWFLRAFAEYRDTIDAGGKVYFPTLTYSPESLPLFNTKTGKLCHNEKKYGKNKYCVPCFSKADIKRYIKTMRKKFERLGITGLKYLVCSEYGETTQRPHYHALIYIPKNNLTESKVQSILLDSWKFGIAFWSPLGAEIQSQRGILYVTKYVCKDISYIDTYESIRDFQYSSKRNRQLIDEYMPHHHQSKGFGLNLFKWLLDKDNIDYYIENGVSDDYLGLGNQGRSYPIPRYIREKIMFTKDENGERVPSPMGHEITMKLLHYRINKAAQNFSKCFTTQGLKAKINDDDCHQVINNIEKYEYTNDIKGLRNFLTDKMRGRTLQELAIYKYCFRNLLVDDMSILEEADNLSVSELESIGYALTDASFDQQYYDVYSESVKNLGLLDNVLVWNYAKRFENFETVLDVIQNINSLAAKRRQRKRTQDDSNTNKLKNILIK